MFSITFQLERLAQVVFILEMPFKHFSEGYLQIPFATIVTQKVSRGTID